MNVNDLFGQLSVNMGLPGLALNKEGMARLEFDGHTVVDFEYESDLDSLHLYAVLDRLPTEACEEVYSQLLVGNLFTRQTRGAVLAISPLEQEIVLTRTIPLAKLDYQEFTDVLESFIAAAEEWAARLAQDAVDRELSRERPHAANAMADFQRIRP